MAPNKPLSKKKFFTVAEANATLPLVRVIVQDIADLALSLRDRHERLTRVRANDRFQLAQPHEEEFAHIQEEYEKDQERMHSYEQELADLGVELKDYFTGLIDFPCLMNGREVYLCWKLGEPELGYWHELNAGFAGRQKLPRQDLAAKGLEASN
jgi:hypothetical protein